jgi:hypothetical protein
MAAWQEGLVSSPGKRVTQGPFPRGPNMGHACSASNHVHTNSPPGDGQDSAQWGTDEEVIRTGRETGNRASADGPCKVPVCF